jgi:GT2 family glycosyltransferase
VGVSDRPTLTVIVPTHNRRAAVLRLLEALSRQQVRDATFNAVVAVDGSTDGTAQALRQHQWPFELDVLDLPAAGPGAARNEGARRATGRILVFLDDDVEPDADTIAAHIAVHAVMGRVGIGMLPPAVSGDSLFTGILRYWWTTMQETIRRPGHRFSFKDLLSGHFSMEASRFHALGGFDRTLRCHEDYELGFRAIQSGLEFTVAPGAEALHHDDSTVNKVLHRKFEEGVADVALARRHPALVGGLPFAWRERVSRKKQTLRRVAWSASRGGDGLARRMQDMLPMYEAASLRFRWRALLEALLDYWYWRGVADVLHDPRELEALLATASPEPAPMRVDLGQGFAAAEALLDEHRPATAQLVAGADTIATVPAYPGYEPLRGAHLRPLLARWCPVPYLQVAARQGRVPEFFVPSVAHVEPE